MGLAIARSASRLVLLAAVAACSKSHDEGAATSAAPARAPAPPPVAPTPDTPPPSESAAPPPFDPSADPSASAKQVADALAGARTFLALVRARRAMGRESAAACDARQTRDDKRLETADEKLKNVLSAHDYTRAIGDAVICLACSDPEVPDDEPVAHECASADPELAAIIAHLGERARNH